MDDHVDSAMEKTVAKCHDVDQKINPKKPNELYNLILGQTGAGKSTWINSIFNYIQYTTLEKVLLTTHNTDKKMGSTTKKIRWPKVQKAQFEQTKFRPRRHPRH